MATLGTLFDAVVLGATIKVIDKSTEKLREPREEKETKREPRGLGLF
jgi:hypothetical protein